MKDVKRNLPAWATHFGKCRVCKSDVPLDENSNPHPRHVVTAKHKAAQSTDTRKEIDHG